MLDLSALIDTVQKNCTIADARHARDMTMCTFLLEMREYYRWEMEIPYGARLPKDELGDWLNARESLWDAVEEENFAPLPLTDSGIDPFEANDINRALRVAQKVQAGYVWVNGVGQHYRGVPYGGFKNSGIGREEGISELLSYTEEKVINVVIGGGEYNPAAH